VPLLTCCAVSGCRSVSERLEAFKRADVVLDGSLTRLEFCSLCHAELGHLPISQIEAGVRNLQRTKAAMRNKWRAKWKAVADDVDRQFRVWLPSMYTMAMIVLFNLEMGDLCARASPKRSQSSALPRAPIPPSSSPPSPPPVHPPPHPAFNAPRTTSPSAERARARGSGGSTHGRAQGRVRPSPGVISGRA
jgi:hypothetical protein